MVVQERQQLDSVKDWVLAAAGSVPKTAAGEQMLVPIVAKGCVEITDIVSSSNGELATIAERIRKLSTEYGSLGVAGEPMQGDPPPLDPLDEILRNYQGSEDPDGNSTTLRTAWAARIATVVV